VYLRVHAFRPGYTHLPGDPKCVYLRVHAFSPGYTH
jgi:hypothetical protein